VGEGWMLMEIKNLTKYINKLEFPSLQ